MLHRQASFKETKENYSALKDSTLAKYAGNTASIFAVLDAGINCISSRLSDFHQSVKKQIPFYFRGLYYLVPIVVPFIPFVRNRWKNKPEKFDPDAIELLQVLRKNDDEFDVFLYQNPEESDHILEIFSSYLKHEKRQKFNIVINLLILGIRSIQGLMIFIDEMNIFSKETDEKLADWIELISIFSNMTYLIISMVQNNFFNYSYSGKKHHQLFQMTLFKFREINKTLTDNTDLVAPPVSEVKR